MLQNRLQTNLSYDNNLTSRLINEAIDGLSITRGMVQKGEVIVYKGSVINDDVYQKLESYKQAFEDNARTNGNRKLVLLGQFFLVGIAISLLMIFLHLFRKDIYADNRLVSLILLVMTAMLATLSLAIKLQFPTNLYYIPYCIVPIIIRILFDTRLALNIHLLVVLIAGFFVPNSFEFAYYEITAGMVSIYSIKNLIRREQFLISAVIIIFTYFVAFLGITFIREGTFLDIDWMDFLPFVVSVLLTLLAYPLIYIFEKIFAITSAITSTAGSCVPLLVNHSISLGSHAARVRQWGHSGWKIYSITTVSYLSTRLDINLLYSSLMGSSKSVYSIRLSTNACSLVLGLNPSFFTSFQ